MGSSLTRQRAAHKAQEAQQALARHRYYLHNFSYRLFRWHGVVLFVVAAVWFAGIAKAMGDSQRADGNDDAAARLSLRSTIPASSVPNDGFGVYSGRSYSARGTNELVPASVANRPALAAGEKAVPVPGGWRLRYLERVPGRDDSIHDWLQQLKPQAQKQGIDGAYFDEATSWITIDWDVYRSSQRQAEFFAPMRDYLQRRVTDARVKRGREELIAQIDILDELEQRYQVDRELVVAIWGLETNYGSFKGNKNVLRSLATLGYLGWRTKFVKQQLIGALQVAQQNDISPRDMFGSFAGAMGHTQFIPTTYLAHAVDYDGDGKRDILENIGDALASTASYIRHSGWQGERVWGVEVMLPDDFDYGTALSGRELYDADYWRSMGVRHISGRALDLGGHKARLILPIGAQGPAFLVTKNFNAILAYNRSVAYALSVALLADRLAGRGGDDHNWSVDGLSTLSVADRKTLQRMLNQAGYDAGAVDGVIGAGTRAAVRQFQEKLGLPADGHPSIDLLNVLASSKP